MIIGDILNSCAHKNQRYRLPRSCPALSTDAPRVETPSQGLKTQRKQQRIISRKGAKPFMRSLLGVLNEVGVSQSHAGHLWRAQVRAEVPPPVLHTRKGGLTPSQLTSDEAPAQHNASGHLRRAQLRPEVRPPFLSSLSACSAVKHSAIKGSESARIGHKLKIAPTPAQRSLPIPSIATTTTPHGTLSI